MPEEIKAVNIEKKILEENPELNLQKGSIAANIIYVTKRMLRNTVVEVGAEIRKTLLNKKLRLGWQICKTNNYLRALNA